MCLEGLHRGVGLKTDLVVFGLGGIDLVDELFELMKGKIFVEFDVDIGGEVRVVGFAFCWRFGVFSFDEIGDGGLKDIVLAIFGDLI